MNLLLALFLLCPLAGSAHTAWEKHQNTLKNRTGEPAQFVSMQVEDLLRAGPEDFADFAAAELDGWVVLVKRSGPESCNCFDKKRVDLHILIGGSKGTSSPLRSVVVEVTPRRPVKNASVQLVGRHVLVRGWLFYDGHHVHEPGRGTAWEIHPVTSIQVIE